MTISFRPKGGSAEHTPMYAPSRDIAYLLPSMIKSVLQHLDRENRNPAMTAVVAETGVLESDIDAAVGKLAEVNKLLLRQGRPIGFDAACEASGFVEVSPIVQTIIMSEFGRAYWHAISHALKDVTTMGQLSPAHSQYVESVAAFVLAGKPPAAVEATKLNIELELARADMFEHSRVNKQQLEIIAQLRNELAELKKRGSLDVGDVSA